MKNIFSVIAWNSFFGVAGKLSTKIIAFVFTVVIVRWLGDEQYGEYVLIWSYVMIFSMLSDAGLGMYAVREIARQTKSSRYIVSNIILLRLILSVLTIILITTTAWLLNYPEPTLAAIFLASTVLILYAVQDPLDSILQAKERFDISSAALVTGQLIYVITGFYLLWTGWHIIGLIIAGLLNVAVAALLSWWWLPNRSQFLQWKINVRAWPKLMKICIPFGLIKLWGSWSLKFDVVILSWFWSNQVIGWYGAAQALILGLLVIPVAINAVLYPALTQLYHQNPPKILNLSNLILKSFLLIVLPITAIIFLSAREIISILYGPQFFPAAAVFAIMIWLIPLSFVSEFLRYILLVINRERDAVILLGMTVLFTVTLNLWWTPVYSLFAAAIIWIGSEFALILVYNRSLSRNFQAFDWIKIIQYPVLGTILLLAVMVILPFSLFWRIIFGGGSYLVLLLLVYRIYPDEYESLFKFINQSQKESGHMEVTTQYATEPFVSVFIPVFNAEQFVDQAIASVLAQTYQNFELIIINDGSTDNTKAIIERYRTHPKITIHHNLKNLGMAATWNVGLELCRGQFVAKLDADDYYEPIYLESVVNFFGENDQAGLVFTGLNLIYPDGRQESEVKSLFSWVRHREVFFTSLLRLCIIRSPTVCVKRSCYAQLGKFIPTMKIHADWEMWVRIASHYPVGYIARRLANYRMSHGTNVTAQAALNGASMDDLKIWLDLLQNNQLPYQLSSEEENQLKWGMYEMEMHFAAMAAYYQQEAMQAAYTEFAEQLLPYTPTDPKLEKMRQANLNLHQGLLKFRDCQLKEARQYFLRALRAEPAYTRVPWIWSKLLLTLIGRTKWGILYK